MNNKKKACEYTGIRSLSYELPEETTQEELLSLVRELNDREDVNGILVQLPLPAHMDEDEVINVVPCSLGEAGGHDIHRKDYGRQDHCRHYGLCQKIPF